MDIALGSSVPAPFSGRHAAAQRHPCRSPPRAPLTRQPRSSISIPNCKPRKQNSQHGADVGKPEQHRASFSGANVTCARQHGSKNNSRVRCNLSTWGVIYIVRALGEEETFNLEFWTMGLLHGSGEKLHGIIKKQLTLVRLVKKLMQMLCKSSCRVQSVSQVPIAPHDDYHA